MSVRSSEIGTEDHNFMSERLPSIKNFLRELSFGFEYEDRDELFNKFLEEHDREIA